MDGVPTSYESPRWFWITALWAGIGLFDATQNVFVMRAQGMHHAVFVTAYDQYALRAFEAGALDYLLKPFDNARFDRALDRAKQRIARDRDHPRKLDRVVIKNTGEVTFVKISEIDWIEAADYYACLHVGTRNHLLRRSLTELEQELDPNVFCRIHRSTIVNLDRVRGLKLGEDGEYDVLLENGARLGLSRRYRKEVQSRLGVRNATS